MKHHLFSSQAQRCIRAQHTKQQQYQVANIKKTKSSLRLTAIRSALQVGTTANPQQRESQQSQIDRRPFTLDQYENRGPLYDDGGRIMLKNLTKTELAEWCIANGLKGSKAMQFIKYMYYIEGKGPHMVRSFRQALANTTYRGHAVADGFSEKFLDEYEDKMTVDGGIELIETHTSDCGTQKLVFKVTAGPMVGGRVETVIIPKFPGQGRSNGRTTVCVSSQIGCQMGCKFCYTAKMGLRGNLNTAQIVEQILEARRILGAECSSYNDMTNIVFMGMGEPFDNFDAVVAATEILQEPKGCNITCKRICVSTVGLIPQMRRYLQLSSCTLAVSLHAADDETRSKIVPMNHKYTLADIVSVLREHYPANGKAKLMVEYVLLKGVNDSLEDARKLADLLQGIYALVNLINFNPHPQAAFQPTSETQLMEFMGLLNGLGTRCTIRMTRGSEEMAACGQLGSPVGSLYYSQEEEEGLGDKDGQGL